MCGRKELTLYLHNGENLVYGYCKEHEEYGREFIAEYMVEVSIEEAQAIMALGC